MFPQASRQRAAFTWPRASDEPPWPPLPDARPTSPAAVPAGEGRWRTARGGARSLGRIAVPDSTLPATAADHAAERRRFLGLTGLAALGLGVLPAEGALAGAADAPTKRDVAILRFLAAAELIETDLWQQYAELAEGNPGYGEALAAIDDDLPDYTVDVTEDELSHAEFINAYLQVGRRRAGQPRPVPDHPAAEREGAAAGRPPHQPDRPHGRHQLLHPLPEHEEPRLRRHLPADRDRPRPAGDPDLERAQRPGSSAPSRASRRSTSPRSSRAAAASTTSSSPSCRAGRCCGSSARSTAPRRSTTRSSATRSPA